MPIHDLGYRAWEGGLTSLVFRWCAIAECGVAIAWKNVWLRRMVVAAWLPALYFGVAFFAYEFVAKYIAAGEAAEMWAFEFLGQGWMPEELLEQANADPVRARRLVWANLLLFFFRYPQAILVVLVVGLIAPPLISQDIRSRAFILYFSRPITRIEYLLGKASIVWFYCLLITTAPALVLYALASLLSPSLTVIADTWDLPFRIMVASAVLAVPTTVLALTFSSLTMESRNANYAWFATWILGWFAYGAYYSSLLSKYDPEQADDLIRESSWTLVSLYHTLGRVQAWVMGVEKHFDTVANELGLLIAVTLVSTAILSAHLVAHASVNLTMTTSKLLDLHHVTKLYRSVIGINDVTLAVEPGAYGLLGPNGSGKTTLLNLLTGQLRTTLGTVRLLGQQPWNNDALLKRIGVCPSTEIFFPAVSGLEWVAYLLQLHGWNRKTAIRRAGETLETVGMGESMQRPLDSYSKGMRQRTKLAQALAHDPDFLLLDEPFNGLDPVGRHEMTAALKEWTRRGKSLLLASHVLHEVEAIATSFLLICGGRLLASGSASEVRDLLTDIPTEIEIRCDQPRDLARALLEAQVVESVRLPREDHGEHLIVSTSSPLKFFEALPEIITRSHLRVSEMHSPDESLQALLTSLLKIHRGESP